MEAGDPETLRAAINEAKGRRMTVTVSEPVPVSFVKDFKGRRDAEKADRQKQADYEKATPGKRARREAIKTFFAVAEDSSPAPAKAAIARHLEHLSAAERKEMAAAARKVIDDWSALEALVNPVPLREAAE
jgi:hypothetical protein